MTNLYNIAWNTTGWACGASGKITYTADGGQTWTPQNSNTTAALYRLSFYNALNGMSVGGGTTNSTALITHDGGNTWTPTTAVPTSIGLWGIDMVSPTLAYAAANGGIICRYIEGAGIEQENSIPVNSHYRLTTVCKDVIKITYNISNANKPIHLKIYDLSGKLIYSENLNNVRAGTNTLSLHGSVLKNGVFFYEIGEAKGKLIHIN
jgi:hypothetical protein